MKSKLSKATAISKEVRQRVWERDKIWIVNILK